MSQLSYAEIPTALRNRQNFQGNSMSAVRAPDGTYVVYSYNTVIANVTPNGDIAINERKYSKTTSRHQNLVRDNL